MAQPAAPALTLNAGQREALSNLDAPLRVIAGPGTGKTTTVVAMYLHLIRERGLRPSQVLCLTFASNAAADIKARVDALYRESYDESWVSTFHSFATRVLTQFGREHGIPPFTLMNGFQEKLLMRHVLRHLEHPLETLGPLQGSDALAQDTLWLIGILKQNLVRSDDFEAVAATAGNPKLLELARVYRAYWLEQDRLRLWDFRDVIAQCWLLLERDEDLRQQLSEKFRHVIVDEYQDVDAAQVKLIAQLTRDHTPRRRLAVVGDPNQSIYSFRGTQPAYLEDEWQFGGNRVELSENYRSYGQIVDASARLLQRYDLPRPALEAIRGKADVPILALDREQNAVDEASTVVRHMQALLAPRTDGRRSYRPGDMAVIVRSTRRSGRAIEEALRAANIPHATGVSPTFAASEVVRFGVAALRALAEPDDDRHLAEVLESAFGGVPTLDSRRLLAEARRRQASQPETLQRRSLLTVLKHTCFLLRTADSERWPLPWDRTSTASDAGTDELDVTPEAPEEPSSETQTDLEHEGKLADDLEAASQREETPRRPPHEFFGHLSPEGRDAIHRFTWNWVRLAALVGRISPEALVYRVFQDLGVLSMILAPDLLEARRTELLGPLRMFLRAATDYIGFSRTILGTDPSLQDIVGALDQALAEYVDELESPDPEDQGVVRIMTAHASKGLEFPVVFTPALAAQRFPVVARARTPLLTDAERAWLEASLVDFMPPWPRDDSEFLKEEARLAYVASTRAKDMLFISWADEYERQEPAAPSAFIEPLVGAQLNTDALKSACVVFREYAEIHRDPSYASGAIAPRSEAEVQAFLEWEPWSRPAVVDGSSHDSASSISTFLACPRKYYYAKTLGLTESTGVAATRGLAFHDALAKFHAPEMELKWRWDSEAAYRLYREITSDAVATHVGQVDGKLEKQLERKQLQLLFDNYFASEIASSATPAGGQASPMMPATLATERHFEWQPIPGVTVVGYIDRIIELPGGGQEIADYKTGRGATKGAVEGELGLGDGPARSYQMLIYLLGSREGEVEGLGGIDPRVVGLWYPKDLMKRPPEIRKIRIVEGEGNGGYPKDRTIYLDEEAMDGLRSSIMDALTEIGSGLYLPKPRHDSYTCISSWGTGCDFAWVCPGRIEEPEEYEAV